MPYIVKEFRPNLDTLVEIMASMGIKADGDLNYVLFKYCKYHIEPGYKNYKNFLGELDECRAEIRRKLLSKYEDKKIEENGDV
jgi:hypothetical protein